MKKLMIILPFLFLFTVNAQEEEGLKWLTDFETAREISKTENKPILMYFTGSDWCTPCKMLKEDFFITDRFKKNSEKLVLLEVDLPRREDIISPEQKQKNKALINRYNKKGGFPNIVAIDHTGNVLGEIGAYSSLRNPSKHFNFVEALLQRN